MPKLLERHLPALTSSNGETGSLQEREILYKLLFEMKKDLNDLKGLVFDLISRNDLAVPDVNPLKEWEGRSNLPMVRSTTEEEYHQSEDDLSDHYKNESESSRPIILERNHDSYDRAEIVEENLSLEEMEKELIQKALRKHKGRRKDAAIDLGISERTLYRKIKQYEL